MGCSTRYATAADYSAILCADVDLNDPDEVTQIETALDAAAGEISVNIAAVGACDCTFTAGATAYLKRLNVTLAALTKKCPCTPNLSADEVLDLREWANAQLEMIRTGKVPLCVGDTGSEYMAFGTVENNSTPWAGANIAYNRRLRGL